MKPKSIPKRITQFMMLLFVLAACASPKPPNSGTSVSIVSATALTKTSVTVVFSEAVGIGADVPTNFIIKAPDGSRLEVMAAYRGADQTMITLATAHQVLQSYGLEVQNIQSASGSGAFSTLATDFDGSGKEAPIIEKAIALSNTEILVRFSANMDGGEGVLDASNYSIVDPDLAISAVDFPRNDKNQIIDKQVLILTTDSQLGKSYTLKVTNVKTPSSKHLIDPFGNTVSFNGLTLDDNTAPQANSVVSTSNTTVLINLSEPVMDSASDSSHYSILGPDGQNLVITEVSLNPFNTQVFLTTLSQTNVDYTLTIAGIEDRAGNVIDSTASTVFSGISAADNEPPRVVGSASISNNKVIVTFSEAMDKATAEIPEHYSIIEAGEDGIVRSITPQRAVVMVQSASLDANDPTVVTLTTLSQSDLEYQLTVTNVRDLAGNQIAPPDLAHPFHVKFFGTPPTVVSGVDTDDDGLSDESEQRGWTITTKLLSGEVSKREVTSDPNLADTDGDGIGDFDEKHYGTNPRSSDTDNDDLSDYKELNHIYSDPANQDSDGDTLTDGLEFNFFKTSPTLDDTDSDQLKDFDEINLGNRDPRLADLPLVAIEIGDVDMQLDVRFTAVSEEGTRDLESENVTSTLTQTDNRSFSNTDSNTQEVSAKIGGEHRIGWEGTSGLDFTNSIHWEAGYTGQWTSSFTRDSSEESQKSYEKSLSTEEEITRDESITREINAASMRVTLSLRNFNSIAFNIKNVQIAAFMQDPDNLGSLIPIATLVPESDPSGGFNLGPLVPERGPLIFVSDQVFPNLVEELMQDPRGLVFRVVNFDIEDELGRNFAFTSQEINDRTASLVIDYGGFDGDEDGFGDDADRYRVATNAGRMITDINNDGMIDDGDRILFDLDGQQVGITMQEALENIVGLTHYDEDATPSNTLSPQQRRDSYATKLVNGTPILWRVGNVSTDLSGPLKEWRIVDQNGLDPLEADVNGRILNTEEGVNLAFVQDIDDDCITARWEYILGTSDRNTDTDSDGLEDGFEHGCLSRRENNEWSVKLPQGDKVVYSSPARIDTVTLTVCLTMKSTTAVR